MDLKERPIGVFDSGVGGISTLRAMIDELPQEHFLYYGDMANAPYGTKSPHELIALLRADVRRVREAGADEVLIACCTASTVFDRLMPEEKVGVYPIITPTAKAAVERSKSGRIGVLATEATVLSRAFTREILRIEPRAYVTELAAQRFVSYVECARIDRGDVQRTVEKIKSKDIDTLILGCTHFPRLSGIISEYADNITIISSAKEGARLIARSANLWGSGATIYL